MSIKFGDKEYELVPDRLLKFRESNPRASIKSESIRHEDGSIEFITIIIQDKADEYSAEADGHAVYNESELKKAKAFEKLETISVGRALAKLGYLNDGKIASTEEMEEFEGFKLDKFATQIDEATTVEELLALFNKMNGEEKKLFTEKLTARKKELSKKELANATA